MANFLFNAPPCFDYQWLMDQLKDHKSPRAKVTQLLKKNEMIRVKKGLYLPASKYNKPCSKELLANLIYGPSYISLEYALAYYGLIPERVETITSVTNKRHKRFSTPIGMFLYKYLSHKYYSLGFNIIRNGNSAFFIATKEKALCDMIYFNKSVNSQKDVKSFLFEELRIEPDLITDIDITLLQKIVSHYSHQSIKNLLLITSSLKK